MKRIFYFLLPAFLIFCIPSFAQQLKKADLQAVYGENAIRKKTFATQQARTMDATRPPVMRTPIRYKMEYRKFKKFKPGGVEKNMGNDAEESLSRAEAADDRDEADDAAEDDVPPNVWSNYLAASFEEAPYMTPPDPNGAVSGSQVVVATNASIKVFEKRSVTEKAMTTPKGTSRKHAPEEIFMLLDDFFAPALPAGSYAVDPHVRFDRLTRRWFFSAMEVNAQQANNYIMLAVSDAERLDESTSFLYYRFRAGAVIPYNPAAPLAPFLDFPRMGVDRNAVVIGGVNFFSPNGFTVDSVQFVGFLLDKRRLTRGQLVIYGLKLGGISNVTFTGGGMFVPQGVHNDDPAASQSFFAGLSVTTDALSLASISFNASGVPTGGTVGELPVQPFNFPRDVTAIGSPMPIDALDGRLLVANIHKNKITGTSSLWTAHAIGVNRAGGFVPDDAYVAEARTASRWYEVGNIYSRPSIGQYGTVHDDKPSGRRAIQYFNPSIMANGQGHALLGGTTAAFNKRLNVFVADRFAGDAAGTTNAPMRVTNTKALYALVYGNYIGRWGDYSQTVVDPDDDQTLWTFQEYTNVDDSYGTRAVQLKAPPPATPMPLGLISSRRDTVLTIKGLSIDRSGFFDPGADRNGPGYNRLSVKSTGGIPVSNVTFISPTEIKVRLNTRNKAAGTYTLIITNPDGQAVTTNYHVTPQAIPGSDANAELLKAINSVKVTPNPTNGAFKLQFQSPVNFTGKALVMDVNGKQLLQQPLNVVVGYNEISISLADFTDGAYIVAIFDTSGILVATQVVIKQ
ncbi:T9SS type A sorting domain-containing protein [Pseudocnuella soli]|uniref:T9SS type A sorting domain-containing protein n=1 Tax=Pseudocnuella soli TaxID=2502779 RepID=UPI00104F2E39|nr:T9SS type A sorting domain-containing protein [Pseudocnuella soli]